jgi:hypothetical protein
MSTNDSSDQAALAAAAAAAEAQRIFTIELWTFYGVGVLMTILRTYSRVKMVGFGNLKADDWLVWCAIVCVPLQFYTFRLLANPFVCRYSTRYSPH